MATVDKPILLLDDEPNVVEFMSSRLQEAGYACVCETSPVRALERLERGAFALLITDLRMPEMNGLELVRRAKLADPDLAVVVVTAASDVPTAIEAIHAGADDYLLKPYNVSDLGTAADRAIHKRAASIQNRLNQDRLRRQVQDATEDLARVTAELRETKQYLVSLLDSTVDAIISTDDSNRVTFINQGALRMLGCLQHEILNAPASILYAGGEEEVEYIRRKLAQLDRMQDYETELNRKDGGKVPVNVSLSCLRETDGRVRSILAICKDITRQKQLERELKEMSMRDSLTGLYNQGCFFDRLEQEMERARRQRHPLALLLFDVDQFKSYNDSRGHLEGDRVLQAVGKLIAQSTREHVDIGFRYGGDEFTVILPEADADQACLIAERIRKGFLSQGFDRLSLSIGMAQFQDGNSVKSFVHRADAAMYEAKRSGGNRVCVCSDAIVGEHRAEEVFRA